MTKQWIVDDLPQGVLVRPEDDIVIHTATRECVCAPRVEIQGWTCGCYGRPLLATRMIITHQAMDGRE